MKKYHRNIIQSGLQRSFTALTAILSFSLCASVAAADTTLWRIGKVDNRDTEFTAAANTPPPTAYAIPVDWATRATWPEWPASTADQKEMTTDISFPIRSAPKNGAEFVFKTTWANERCPELAVFCNGNPCGIIQIAGGKYWAYAPHPDADFRTQYRVYIPREFFVSGTNSIRLQKLGHPYKRELFNGLAFGWDYFELDALSNPTSDPINGKLTYMGIQAGQFPIDTPQVAVEEAMDTWNGVAYCGNPQRAIFWNDLVAMQPQRLAYLNTLKSLMITPIMDGFNCAHYSKFADGKDYVANLFKTYGNLFNYYELCNEPCMGITQANYQTVLAVAQYVKQIKPTNVKLAAPGYANGGGFGNPLNWDDESPTGIQYHKELEQYCDATNGHAYAGSTWGRPNGQFYQTFDTYATGNPPQLLNGFPKEVINTECGSGDDQTDIFEVRANPAINNAPYRESVFDLNIRSQISFVDRFTAFSFYGEASTTFVRGADAATQYISNSDMVDPSKWVARDFSNYGRFTDINGDTRVKIFRRLALSYSTHGKPLPYIYVNHAQIANKLVYFRAVDASKLASLPGSGATSNKILLSFVNHDLNNPNTISVRVRMPAPGTYKGQRIGPENTWTQAHTVVNGLVASPTVKLTENLGPGESVEYILDTRR